MGGDVIKEINRSIGCDMKPGFAAVRSITPKAKTLR